MTSALLILDAQLDFTEGGALGIDGATEAFRRTAEMVTTGLRDGTLAQDFDLVVTTQDWHVDPGEHWSAQPDYRDSWPVHCRAGSAGAQIHPVIEASLRGLPHERMLRVTKGQHEAATSAFDGADADGEGLEALLRARAVDAVHLAGVSTEQCVRATALEAVSSGFQVHLLTAQVAAADPARGPAAIQDMRERGVRIGDAGRTWHPS